MEEQGNFHVVSPGEAYRSAQLDQDELQHYLAKFKIRSVINLRGVNRGEPWYEEEIQTCSKMGVKHFDLGLSATKAPRPDQVRTLLKFFAFAPRPVLIHCQGGADRSGLAAALWKMVVDAAPKTAARKQLSFRFGHLPFGPTQVLDDFLDRYRPRIALPAVPLSRASGRVWAKADDLPNQKKHEAGYSRGIVRILLVDDEADIRDRLGAMPAAQK